jgi:hypothetical protein
VHSGLHELRVSPTVTSIFGLSMDGEWSAGLTLDLATLSGTVRTPQGWPMGGVRLSAAGATAVTAADGSYFLVLPYGWSGELVANFAGGSFNPARRSYDGVVDRLVGQDFTILEGYAPRIAANLTPTALRIDWQSGLGWAYRMQYSEDLRIWHDLGVPVTGTGGMMTRDVEAAAGSARRFYRLLLDRD